MAMILISIMVFCSLAAPPANMLMVFESEGMNPYENLYRAVCQVESSGNPLAIGDKQLVVQLPLDTMVNSGFSLSWFTP